MRCFCGRGGGWFHFLWRGVSGGVSGGGFMGLYGSFGLGRSCVEISNGRSAAKAGQSFDLRFFQNRRRAGPQTRSAGSGRERAKHWFSVEQLKFIEGNWRLVVGRINGIAMSWLACQADQTVRLLTLEIHFFYDLRSATYADSSGLLPF